jgi:hypothetical protein
LERLCSQSAFSWRGAEYTSRATVYNEKAERVSTDNAKIAEAARQIAIEGTKTARLENDTAYQLRRAVEAGMSRPRGVSKQTIEAPALSTSPVELERPDKPKESSVEFLTRWDFWIRLANFGELALAAVTFIYIRNSGPSRSDEN